MSGTINVGIPIHFHLSDDLNGHSGHYGQVRSGAQWADCWRLHLHLNCCVAAAAAGRKRGYVKSDPPLLSLPLCLLPESVLETRVALVVPKLVLVAGVTQDRTHLTSTRASTGHAAGTIPTLLTIALLVFGWTLHMRWSLGPVHNRQCNVWHTPSRECDVKQCYNDNPASNAP